jgi:hypothetical protein
VPWECILILSKSKVNLVFVEVINVSFIKAYVLILKKEKRENIEKISVFESDLSL